MTSHPTPGFIQESDPMKALLEEDDSFISINNGDIVKGEVVRVKHGELYVSLGNKIDGVVAQKDMKTLSESDLAEMEIGTCLSVCVLDNGDGRDGVAELSIDVEQKICGFNCTTLTLDKCQLLAGLVVLIKAG